MPAFTRIRPGDFTRLLLGWVGATITLLVADALIEDFGFEYWWSAPLAALVVGLVGLIVRPVLVALSARLGWIAVFVLAVFGQAIVLAVAFSIVPGVEVERWWVPLVVAWVAALIGSLLSWLGSAGTDDSFTAALTRRARRAAPSSGEGDGLLVVQLDGVAYPVLTWALGAGNMPTLATWLRDGTHTLHEWRPTVPCTTPASQLGLLHGTVEPVPAFRWYDRELGRVLTANHPPDAAIIESRAPGPGLLEGGGVSVSNLFSGGADRTAMVMSRLRTGRGTKITRTAVAWYVVRPDGFARSLFRTIGEIVRERAQAARQVRRNLQPRVPRDWTFAMLRAGSNGVIRDLSTAVVAAEMLRGTPAIYVDYVDYDEVAHHAGVSRRESLAALEALDGVLATLAQVAAAASRHYRIAVVSDHGQSQGETFLQLRGESLATVVRRLADSTVDSVEAASEDYARVRALAEEMAGSGRGSSTARRAAERMDRDTATGEADGELIVLASGNLGMVYARGDRRLGADEIETRWPHLMAGLVTEPGVGCVVAMTDRGPVALGPEGTVELRTGTVTGSADPLAPYGPGARERLLPTADRDNAPELYVISACDPATGDVHAFEELVGSHGGLGGAQDQAVLLAPTGLTTPEDGLLSADAVFRVLHGWRRELGHELAG